MGTLLFYSEVVWAVVGTGLAGRWCGMEREQRPGLVPASALSPELLSPAHRPHGHRQLLHGPNRCMESPARIPVQGCCLASAKNSFVEESEVYCVLGKCWGSCFHPSKGALDVASPSCRLVRPKSASDGGFSCVEVGCPLLGPLGHVEPEQPFRPGLALSVASVWGQVETWPHEAAASVL